MQKVATYSTGDLAFDASGIAERLTARSTSGRQRYWVRGVCQTGDDVHFILLPRQHREREETYAIAPVLDTTQEGMAAMLLGRWQSGFDTVGMIDLGDGSFLGVFARGDRSA